MSEKAHWLLSHGLRAKSFTGTLAAISVACRRAGLDCFENYPSVGSATAFQENLESYRDGAGRLLSGRRLRNSFC